MEKPDEFPAVASKDELKKNMSYTPALSEKTSSKTKGKTSTKKKVMKHSVNKSKIHLTKHFKCDRENEHGCPPWMDNYKTVYGPPLLSSFLIIDIKKIFRRNFEIPKLERITRLQGIELLAELLGMYDFETNLISYWTVDLLSQVIRKCQRKSMREQNIKMCILWLHFILLTIHKKHPSRKKLFELLCLMFNRGMRCLPKMVVIPHPYHIKQKMDKQREKKKDAHTSKNMPDETTTKQVEEPKKKGKEEGVGVAEIKEQEEKKEQSRVAEELEEDSDEESLSMEDESEEDEITPEKEYGDDFSDSSSEEVGQEGEEYLSLEEEIEIPEEVEEKLKQIPNEIVEAWKTNKRDFYILIDIIYRIFANRFKYTVIWEAFAKPPQPKIIGIGNNLKIPKKARVVKPVTTSKVTLKVNNSSSSLEKKHSRPSKSASAKEKSLTARNFPSIVKMRRERKIKKISKHIRPLAEAVNKRFFDMIADHKYKEIRYAQYMKKMEAIKRRFNIKREINDQLVEDLKALIAKHKKRKPISHKAERSGRTKTKKR